MGVTADELMLFAYVCDIAPAYFLITPEPGDASVQISPSCVVDDRELLRRWVRGEAPLPSTDASLYHFTSLETLRTSDAKAAFLDRTKQIVEQFQADADAYAQRSRVQMRDLLNRDGACAGHNPGRHLRWLSPFGPHAYVDACRSPGTNRPGVFWWEGPS